MIKLSRRKSREPRLVAVEALAKIRYALYSLARARAVLESAHRRTGDESLKAIISVYKDIELALEKAAIRLEVIVSSGILSRLLVLSSLRDLEGLARLGMPPPAAQLVAEASDELASLYTLIPESPSEGLLDDSITRKAGQASEILSAAAEEAKRRLSAAGASGES